MQYLIKNRLRIVFEKLGDLWIKGSSGLAVASTDGRLRLAVQTFWLQRLGLGPGSRYSAGAVLSPMRRRLRAANKHETRHTQNNIKICLDSWIELGSEEF